MNIQLLQWGLFTFMLGLVLSLPVAFVHYRYSDTWSKIFTNPRKLTAAHLDFFTQAFALAFVYVLEMALKHQFPLYVATPLIFGAICNPTILLLEATSLARSRLTKLLRATSPISLFFAWFVIMFDCLPMYLAVLFFVFVLIGFLVILNYKRQLNNVKELTRL